MSLSFPVIYEAMKDKRSTHDLSSCQFGAFFSSHARERHVYVTLERSRQEEITIKIPGN